MRMALRFSDRISRRSGTSPSGFTYREHHQRDALRRRALGPLPRLPRRLVPAAAARGRAAAAVRPAPLRGLHHRGARRDRAAATAVAARSYLAQRGARLPPLAVSTRASPPARSGCCSASAGRRARSSGARDAARARARRWSTNRPEPGASEPRRRKRAPSRRDAAATSLPSAASLPQRAQRGDVQQPPLGHGRSDRGRGAVAGGRDPARPSGPARPSSAASRWRSSSASSRWRSPTRAPAALLVQRKVLDHAHVQSAAMLALLVGADADARDLLPRPVGDDAPVRRGDDRALPAARRPRS